MNTKKFIYSLNESNPELIKKMSCCKSPEEAYQVAKDAGLTDTQKELTTVMSALNNVIGPDPQDLEGTTLGSKTSDISTIVTGSTSVAASAASAAAACY